MKNIITIIRTPGNYSHVVMDGGAEELLNLRKQVGENMVGWLEATVDDGVMDLILFLQ